MHKILDHFETIFDFEDILFRADYAVGNPADGDFIDDILNSYEDEGKNMYLSETEAKRIRKLSENNDA